MITKGYIMKKVILAVVMVLVVGFGMLINGLNKAHAGEYETAVIGHIITNSSEIDKEKLFEAELAKIGHKYALEMVSVMQQYLPAIIDGAMADLRLKLDQQYKCELLGDTKIADKECQ
jgi:hypothetical protein